MRRLVATFVALLSMGVPAGDFSPPRPSERLVPFPPRSDLPPPKVVDLSPPRILRVQPGDKGLVPEKVPAVLVSFSQPMDTKAVALKLAPTPPGQFRWLDPFTFIFEPAAGRLPLGTEFTAEVPSGLRSAAGAQSSELRRWVFTTARLRLVDSTPRDGETRVDPRKTLVLRFNAAVDPAEVARVAALKASGETIRLDLVHGNGAEVELRPQRQLPLGAKCELSLPASLRSPEGPLPAEAEMRLRFWTAGPPRVSSALCGPREPWCENAEAVEWHRWSGQIRVHFTNPVRPQKLKAFVHTDPPPSRMIAGEEGITLDGPWRNIDKVHLRIDPGIQDIYGQTLAEPFETTVVPREERSEGLRNVLGNIDAEEPRFVEAYASKRSHGLFKTMALQPADLFAAARYAWGELRGRPDFRETAQQPLSLDSTQTNQRLELPISGPGFWLAELSLDAAALSKANRTAEVVQVTSLGMISAIDGDEIVAAVGTLRENAPIRGARITLYQEPGVVRAEGSTNEQGIAHLHFPHDAQKPLLLVADTGKDRCFEIINASWRPSEPGSDIRVEHLGHLWTDRGAYRPGDTVHAYAIVRDRLRRGAMRLPRGPLHWEASLARSDNALLEGDALLSPSGILAFDVPLAKDQKLGSLYLRVSDYASTSVHVVDARTPESRVRLSMREQTVLIGATAHAEISAETYSGVPMSGARMRWAVQGWARPWMHVSGHEHYTFMPADDPVAEKKPYEVRGEASLDANGHFSLPVFASPECGGPDVCGFTLEVEVIDALQHGIAAGTGFEARQMPFAVGAKQEWRSSATGERLFIDAVAVDLQDRDVSIPVEVRLLVEKSILDPADGPLTEEVEIDRAMAPASFQAPKDERLVVRATARDAHGREARTKLRVYEPPSPAADGLELVADRRTYRPGEMAHLSVHSPLHEGRGVFVVEHAGIVESRAIDFRGQTIDVQIRDEWFPEAQASLVLVAGGKHVWGSIDLPISPHVRDLRLSVRLDRTEVAPGDSVDIVVRSPVRAGIVLTVVDEAALAMTARRPTPDPVRELYGRMWSTTDLQDSRTSFPQRPGSSFEASVGGYSGREIVVTGSRVREKVANSPALRSDFRPTAFFAANLQVQPGVPLHVPVELPDQVSEFRIIAVGVEERAAARVGVATAHVRTRLPLLIQPSLPQFATSGDSFDVTAVVHNLIRTPLDVTLAVHGKGLGLETTERMRISGNGRREVRFPARAGAPGETKVEFVATTGTTHGDAVELVMPVFAPATVETFAAYGATEGAVQLPLDVPADALPGRGGLQISLASTALSGLEESARYVIDYPYECVEQTASRLVALLALRRLPIPQEGRDIRIAAAIRRLTSMQLPTGAFSFWPGRQDESPFGTAWASYALSLAVADGIQEAEGPLLLARDRLQKPHADWPPSVRAIALLANESDRGEVNQLYETRDTLPLFARTLLLDTLVRQKDARSKTLLSELDALVLETAQSVHYAEYSTDEGQSVFASSERTDAAMLRALVAAGESGRSVDKLARGLIASRSGGRWLTTQSNAWALLALSDYYRRFESSTPDFVGGAWLGQKPLALHRFAGASLDSLRTAVPLAEATGNAALILGKTGTGRLHYRVALNLFRPALAAQPLKHGFAISREFRDELDRPRSRPYRLAKGSVVHVHVVVTVPDRRSYVAVADHLPAGLEPLDPTVSTTARFGSQALEYSKIWWDHRELRATGGRAFADDLPAGTYELDYFARATTPGHFKMAGPEVEEMYAPETRARGPAEEVVIQ